MGDKRLALKVRSKWTSGEEGEGLDAFCGEAIDGSASSGMPPLAPRKQPLRLCEENTLK